jgi:uncharacterized protein (DUF1800 family)
MPDLTLAAVAATRFGLGAQPNELAAIAGDPQGWVLAQVRTPSPEPAAIGALPPAEDDLLAFGRWLASRRLRNAESQRLERLAQQEGLTMDQLRAFSLEESFVLAFRDRYGRAVQARMEAAVTAVSPVRERLVHFWSNHFTVSTQKPGAVALPPSFERDVIRGNLEGPFSAMLIASCQHVGMQIYLDNWLSVGPNSRAARSPRQAPRLPGGGGQRRATDINENLAREILELHTLGVDGGYTQEDVRALACIITGWTYDRPRLRDYLTDRVGERRGPDLFVFDADLHEPGAHRVVGLTFAEGGVEQGVAALTALAQHPSTARFLATKLVRHYVADEPQPALVQRIAAAFMASGGDLPATFEALVHSPEAWEAPLSKFRRPEDYVIALMRSLRPDQANFGSFAAVLANLGQRPYSAPGPNGWDDHNQAWMGADQVWKRIEFAAALAARVARADVNAVEIGENALGPLLSPATRQALMRAESPEQALTLLFASPELQRR